MKINEITTIRLGQVDQTKAKAFMAEFEELSQPHPINHKKRILNNVQIELSIFRNRIHITDLLSSERGQGNLGKAVSALKHLADKHQVVLELTAYGYDDVPTETLVKIYSKLGFDQMDEVDGGIDMVYHPQ